MPFLNPPLARILLVDDNRDGLLVRKSLLEEIGCQVEIASGGEEALKLFEVSTFDVVVTDYYMPGMDGAQLIAGIRKVNPRIGIILLSGFVGPLALSEETTGADAVITKTSNEPRDLIRWVKRLVTRTARKPPASQQAARQARAASH